LSFQYYVFKKDFKKFLKKEKKKKKVCFIYTKIKDNKNKKRNKFKSKEPLE
jgi:hypothetical protein